MSDAQAKRLVLVTLVAATGLAAISDIANKGDVPRLRIAIGGVIAGIMLTGMIDFGAREIAVGFALIILTAALLSQRQVIDAATNALGGQVSPTAFAPKKSTTKKGTVLL
jgi:hypothetical protein